jgi:hypothetical protein
MDLAHYGSSSAKALAGNKDIAEKGREWFNAGAGGAIDWGSPGDFEQCVAIAKNHIDNPEGY